MEIELLPLLVPALFLDWAVHNQLVSTLRFGWLNAIRVLSKVLFLVLVVLLVGVLGLKTAGGNDRAGAAVSSPSAARGFTGAQPGCNDGAGEAASSSR